MKAVLPYIDINDVLRHIRLQVEDSIRYAEANVPEFSHPEQLYRWMKDRTVYRKDPPGRELLQSMQTLFDNNYYGVPGCGDCDCFTIACLAACYVQPWPGPLWVKIAGRSKAAPVHIWSGIDWNGKEYPLDLTNRLPGTERPYPYVQRLNFK